VLIERQIEERYSLIGEIMVRVLSIKLLRCMHHGYIANFLSLNITCNDRLHFDRSHFIG